MTEADSSESAGSEKLVDDYEFLDFNNGGLFVQVHFRTFSTSGPKGSKPHMKNSHEFIRIQINSFFALCHWLVALHQ